MQEIARSQPEIAFDARDEYHDEQISFALIKCMHPDAPLTSVTQAHIRRTLLPPTKQEKCEAIVDFGISHVCRWTESLDITAI